MKTVLAFIGLFLLGCSPPAEGKSKKELHQLFAAYMTGHYPELSKGVHVVFIVSKTDCSPCIDAVETLLNANYGRVSKRAVVFDNQLLKIPADVQKINGNAREIAKYGLLSGDGNACVFQNGRLIFAEPINVANPEQLIRTIQSTCTKHHHTR